MLVPRRNRTLELATLCFVCMGLWVLFLVLHTCQSLEIEVLQHHCFCQGAMVVASTSQAGRFSMSSGSRGCIGARWRFCYLFRLCFFQCGCIHTINMCTLTWVLCTIKQLLGLLIVRSSPGVLAEDHHVLDFSAILLL